MKYICLVIIFINFTLANEFQKKHLNQEQINFLNEHPTIIVSNEKHWAPYDYNENGEPKGYSIEYIKLIAKKIGIKITFKTDSWSNLIEKIKSKEIDLIHPLAISEERKEFLNFTQTLLKNDKVIVTNDSNLDIKNLADLKNKTLAVGKGWQSTKILKEKYTNIKLKEYNSSLEMLKAVAYGEVDATIDGFLTINYLKQKHLLSNLHLTGRVEIPTLDQNLYIGVRKDWQILVDIINIAINKISTEELLSLNTKWMIENKKKVIFSKEELDFLKSQDGLSLCTDPEWFPYSKIKDNRHIGMSFNYFEEFRKSIPIPINFLPTKTWAQSLDFAKQKKCDILALAVKTPSRLEYLNFTKPYLNLPLVIATKIDKPFISKMEDVLDYKLSVTKGAFYVELMKKRYPKIKLIEVDSSKEGFQKVLSGEAYGYINALVVVAHQIQNNHLGRLKISGKLDETQKIGVAIRNDLPLLVPIFNKAIDNLSEQKHREILNKWVSIKYESKFNYKYLWLTVSALILIVAFIFYRQYILKRQNTLLQESVEEFEHLLNSTIEAIYITQKGRCIDTNIEGIKLLGFESKEDIKGTHVLDVVAKEHHDLLIENLKHSFSEPYEINMVKKDGTKVPVLVKGKNFILKNKEVRVSGVIDLTQLKNNEKLLVQQSKMVALGEMLENIAHQWRQPLSVISTAASGAKIQKEFGLLKEDEFYASMDGIIENANYLSKTIDDFRNFILADKKRNTFNLKKHIRDDLSILYSMTNVNNIEVISDIDENINLNTIENELTQAFINLINNSKDQFVKDEIKQRYIFINGSIKDQKAHISIKDNAGGIPDYIIDKVFDPYFTTKHKNVGTGLGLYMTRKIINESLDGSISVKNTNYIYKDIKYKGAEFIIKLPLS